MQTVRTVKQPLKILVWSMMSYRDLSELHQVPQGQIVAADYYANEVMQKLRYSCYSYAVEE